MFPDLHHNIENMFKFRFQNMFHFPLTFTPGAKVASPEIQKCFDWPAETLRIFLHRSIL